MYVPVTLTVTGFIHVDSKDWADAYLAAQESLHGLVDTQRGYGRLDLALVDMRASCGLLGDPIESLDDYPEPSEPDVNWHDGGDPDVLTSYSAMANDYDQAIAEWSLAHA